jgi:L-aspartate oxidase
MTPPLIGEVIELPLSSDLSSAQVLLSDRTQLQSLMWSLVGIERNGHDLRKAMEQLNSWRVEGTTVSSFETANLLELARVTTQAALTRCESRGAHFRDDYPASSPEWQRSLVFQQQVAVECL